MSNYEPFFSLQRPLFDSDGGRGFVYESDQLKNAAESFKAAFAKSSPLLCVGGQLGCGKSSTVNYALDQLGEKTRRISLGRIRLSEDEVIDLLLEKLGVEDASGGTIKKLGRFSKCVDQLRADGERVVVMVEDAVRRGSNILSELEVFVPEPEIENKQTQQATANNDKKIKTGNITCQAARKNSTY